MSSYYDVKCLDGSVGENRLVKGHMCEQLAVYQQRSADEKCVPGLGPGGETIGCDDTNGIAIQFCPFCGVKL